MTHTKCKKSWGLDGLDSFYEHSGVIRKAILGFKYKYAYKIGDELSDYLVELLPEFNNFKKDFYLIQIPLDRRRKNWRGFNQPFEVGKLIAAKARLKFLPDLLIRKRFTIPQVELSGKERRQNLKGAFVLNP